MAEAINMPQVGQDIETAVIVEWRVRENQAVKKGDIIAVVESDKATFEVEAFESGTILKLLYKEGEEGRVFEPIAYIGKPGESLEERDAEKRPPRKTERGTPEQKPAEISPGITAGKIFSTPSARRIAREHDIQLNSLEGTGPNRRILKQDVIAALETIKTVSEIETIERPEDTILPFTKMRQRIAERLAQSKRTIPHYYLSIDVDMTAADAWRQAFNNESQVKISVNDLITFAVARTLRKFNKLNAHVDNNRLIVRKDIHIGIAVAVEDGLLVPVIPHADQKTLQEIGRTSRINADAAKRGFIKSLEQGTFTISNLGMYGIRSFLPIINPPECAILGVGQVEKRIVPTADSCIGIRDMLTLSLACDHRAVDGSYGAKFLARLKDYLENADGQW